MFNYVLEIHTIQLPELKFLVVISRDTCMRVCQVNNYTHNHLHRYDIVSFTFLNIIL